MKETLILGALDWSTQKADFVADGSLRDIYIQNATIEDWKIVVAQILDGEHAARLDRVAMTIPADFEALFDGSEGDGAHLMSFTVGTVVLTCHFFTPTEIEFSFAPNDVTESALRNLLGFMIDVGDSTKKPVLMTPENCPESPIFRYDSKQNQLRWISPNNNGR